VQHSYSEEEKIAFVDWINEVPCFRSLLVRTYSSSSVWRVTLISSPSCPSPPLERLCSKHARMVYCYGMYSKLTLCIVSTTLTHHSKLINYSVPETIDERVLNKTNLSHFKIMENQNLCINSAKSVGCNVRRCLRIIPLVYTRANFARVDKRALLSTVKRIEKK
jgi:hypothetical protein